jgi:hypothetical protein
MTEFSYKKRDGTPTTADDPERMVNEYETFEQQQAQMDRNFALTGHCGTFPPGDIPGVQPWRRP